MLQSIGFSTLDELVNSTVPSNILSTQPLKLDEPLTESEALTKIQSMANKNKVMKSYITRQRYVYSDVLS